MKTLYHSQSIFYDIVLNSTSKLLFCNWNDFCKSFHLERKNEMCGIKLNFKKERKKMDSPKSQRTSCTRLCQFWPFLAFWHFATTVKGLKLWYARVAVAQPPPEFNPTKYLLLLTNTNTVKPVYNDHPWDPKIVAVVDRWSLFSGHLCNMSPWHDLSWSLPI